MDEKDINNEDNTHTRILNMSNNYNKLSNEERFFSIVLGYISDWRDFGIPVPWSKIISEAYIAKAIENRLKNSE